VVDFGLGGAVWVDRQERGRSRSPSRWRWHGNVNTPAGEGADLPVGGTKRLRLRRELGPLGSTNSSQRLFYVEK